MDFSSVKATLDSKSYEKVADVCDNLMLQVPVYFILFLFPFLRACDLLQIHESSLRLQLMALLTRTIGPTPFTSSLTITFTTCIYLSILFSFSRSTLLDISTKWLLLYTHVASEINNYCYAIDSFNTRSCVCISIWKCCCGFAATVRAFFGNQYLPQSKRASLKLPRFGKSVRSSGYVTMLECTRQFVALIGVRMSKA